MGRKVELWGVRLCWGLMQRPVLVPADLCGSSEEKQRPSAPGAVLCCSDPGDSEEAKPHSYLEAICSGLEEPGAGGCPGGAGGCPGGAVEQLCPYAAAGTCHFGERCLYLHGEPCEICGLQVLHPFDQEQRKAHEMVKGELGGAAGLWRGAVCRSFPQRASLVLLG